MPRGAKKTKGTQKEHTLQLPLCVCSCLFRTQAQHRSVFRLACAARLHACLFLSLHSVIYPILFFLGTTPTSCGAKTPKEHRKNTLCSCLCVSVPVCSGLRHSAVPWSASLVGNARAARAQECMLHATCTVFLQGPFCSGMFSSRSSLFPGVRWCPFSFGSIRVHSAPICSRALPDRREYHPFSPILFRPSATRLLLPCSPTRSLSPRRELSCVRRGKGASTHPGPS